MKTGRVKGGANRDRAYWEPPRDTVQIEGHIEEIGVDEPPPVPPSSRVQRVRAVVRSRSVLATAGAIAIVAVFLAALVGPLAPSHLRTSPRPSQAATSGLPSQSEQAFTSPTATAFPYWTGPIPTSTPWPVESLSPTATTSQSGSFQCSEDSEPEMKADGWPVTLCSFGDLLVGPDGTLFADNFEPIATSGRVREGWLELPDGSYWPPAVFGSDGTAYVPAGDSSGDTVPLWAFDSNGKARTGWPVDVPSNSTLLAGPSGTLYVLSPNDTPPSIRILGSNGTTRAKWAAPVDGNICGQVLRSDGTLFLAVGPDESTACSIHVYSATGHQLSGTTSREWDGLAMAGDGTVVAWGYDLQPYSSSQIAQTRIAVIGTDGLPVSGWPVTFEGTASSPAFGPDGTIYLTHLGLGTSPSKIVALDQTAATRPGWPVLLPTGHGPLEGAETPVIGDKGTVYAVAVDQQGMGYVMALDPTGSAIPGWPYKLPEPFATVGTSTLGSDTSYQGPLFVRPASGPGLLYLVLEGRIVALDARGNVAPGWPYVVPATDTDAAWDYVAGTPDGGFVTIQEGYTDSQGNGIWLVRRWTPAGKTPR